MQWIYWKTYDGQHTTVVGPLGRSDRWVPVHHPTGHAIAGEYVNAGLSIDNIGLSGKQALSRVRVSL